MAFYFLTLIKKAFDTVDHVIVLLKLELYGIRGGGGGGISLQWFKSYLKNRKQVCSAN